MCHRPSLALLLLSACSDPAAPRAAHLAPHGRAAPPSGALFVEPPWRESWTPGALSELSAFADGDLNGDGYTDLAVGDSSQHSSDGVVEILYGGPGGLDPDAASLLQTALPGGSFGAGLSADHDLNGDGYDDLAVFSATPGTSGGGVDIFLGSSAGLSSVPSLTLTDGSSSSQYGTALASAGDVNGDGYDELMVGAYKAASSLANYAGVVYLYYGSATGLSSGTYALLPGEERNGAFGEQVAGGGDLDGDGYDDVVVAAPDYSSTGKVYVYPGSAGGLATTASQTVEGDGSPALFGRAIAIVGDVEGDGYDDLLVGSYGDEGTGAAWLYAGSASGLDTASPTELAATVDDSGFGRTVAGPGDLNGDGFADLVVGSRRATDTTPQRVWLFAGSASGVATTTSSTLDGFSLEDGYASAMAPLRDGGLDGGDRLLIAGSEGETMHLYATEVGSALPTSASSLVHEETHTLSAVSAAGDLNGDGYDDVIAGATPTTVEHGAARVWYGSAAGLSAAVELGDSGSDALLGAMVAAGFDLDADGLDDAAVRTGEDEVTLYFGTAAGLVTSDSATLTSDDGCCIGAAGGPAGDVDGDGVDDLLLADHDDDPADAVDGEYIVRLYLGGSAGPDEGTAIRSDSHPAVLTGQRAGDLDGDGYGDLGLNVTGPSLDEPAEVEIQYGGASGLDGRSTTLAGHAAADGFGAIAALGDRDADGDDDLAIGATGSGYVDVYDGGASGLSTTASQTLTSSSSTEAFASTLVGLGDLDGDGYPELGIGAPRDGAGAVYLHRGGAAGYADVPDQTLSGELSGDWFGTLALAALDVNGDGASELLAAAVKAPGGGSLYVYSPPAVVGGDTGSDTSVPTDTDDTSADDSQPPDSGDDDSENTEDTADDSSTGRDGFGDSTGAADTADAPKPDGGCGCAAGGSDAGGAAALTLALALGARRRGRRIDGSRRSGART